MLNSMSVQSLIRSKHDRHTACLWLLPVFILALLVPSRAQTAGSSTAREAEEIQQLKSMIQQLQDRVTKLESEGRAKPSEPQATAQPSSVPAGPAAAVVAAATGSAAPPQAPVAEKTTLSSLLGPTSLSGSVDLYYLANFNHPVSRTNALRGFDTRADQIGLNLVQLMVDKAPSAESRLGYRVAVGFGDAINVVNFVDSNGNGSYQAQYLKEGYFSYLAPVGKGLQIDFGKYVTPHGAEVIDTKDNWNYSRGVLFTWAIPFYHFGARAKYAFSDKFAVTGFVTNGWNNVVDNNTGKTYGVGLSWTPTPKFSLAQNYMTGPEQANTNDPWRHLSDTIVTVSPWSQLSFIVNFDYGRDRPAGTNTPVFWTGVAGYAKYAPNDKYALVGRWEYFDDHDGFMTGTRQNLREFTGTFQRVIAGNWITRLEYRHDYSNAPVFVKGVLPDTNQDTFTAGLIYAFDSRGK